MTTACAWCGSVQSVDLVALCRSGLSHGVCVACMPSVFGQEAFERYMTIHPKGAESDYVLANDAAHFALEILIHPFQCQRSF